MFDLEWVLYWGLPGNKWELWDGHMHCKFPFRTRASAESHFAAWAGRLGRWQGIEPTPICRENPQEWQTRIGDFEMKLYPRPIALDVPVDIDAFDAIYSSFWRRDLWPAQPPGMETGWDCAFIFGDVRHCLWRVFGALANQHGGKHGSTDILVSDSVGLKPTHFYFAKPASECLVRRDYFFGVPDLAADVLSAATRFLARGRRMDLYHQVGVQHLWLIEPELETVELYERSSHEYRHVQTCCCGEIIECDLFPGSRIVVDEFFDTQFKRRGEEYESEPSEPPEPAPEWLVPPDIRLGLQYLLLLGHAERRYEVWHGRGPCMLSFGSSDEAGLRFRHFLEEICRWEQVPLVRPTQVESGLEMAEVGRFRLIRHDRRVELDVAFDPRNFRQLYDTWFDNENWDWGET